MIMDTSLNSNIKIKDLTLMINIGVTDEERSIAQKIGIDVQVIFKNIPKACMLDDINQTVCYNTICDVIRSNSYKPYNLIEHFCYDLFNIIKKQIHIENRLILKIKKYPKISDLKDGVEFEISD